MIRFEQKSGDGQLPLVWEITQGADADIDVVIDWLREHRPLLQSCLDRHGVVLLRGLEAIDSAERFEAALGGVTSTRRVLAALIGSANADHPILDRDLERQDFASADVGRTNRPREVSSSFHP